MTTKTVLLALAITLFPASCVDNKYIYGDLKTNNVSSKNINLTFKKYTRTTEEDGGTNLIVDYNENGSIELYGNVIKIDKTSKQEIFFIKTESYDDLNQIYTFNTDKSKITLNVMERNLKVFFYNKDCQETFYLQSIPVLIF
jgi:uncharacterized protein YrzB (UPF0473 family)